MEVKAKVYPELVGNRHSEARLILVVRNNKRGCRWYEADIELPHHLSLVPDYTLRKGKVRLGILRKNEYISKFVKLYSSQYTPPDTYPVKVTVYAYNKEGVVDERLDLVVSAPVVKGKELVVR